MTELDTRLAELEAIAPGVVVVREGNRVRFEWNRPLTDTERAKLRALLGVDSDRGHRGPS